jgi:UDP-N-acetylglucosamine 2-epimerase (non-hydrolysing)
MLGFGARLLHTGQHADEELSGVFFSAAGLPAPQTMPGICGQPRHVQVGKMVEHLGALFARRPLAAVLVQGDTNTALAGAQAGNYAVSPWCTWRPGSGRSTGTCPRRSTGALSASWPTCNAPRPKRAVANLVAEGMPAGRIVLTGNTIAEATLDTMPGDEAARAIVSGAGAEPGQYVLATIHRPENTDDQLRLRTVLDELSKLGLPVLFPLHPRTRLAAERHGLSTALDRFQLLPRPTTARSSAWPGMPASSSRIRAVSRRNARCSSARLSWSGTPQNARSPSTPDSPT